MTFIVSQDRYTGDNLHLRHLNHYHHNPTSNASSARNPAGLERCYFKDFIRVLPQVLETLHGRCRANGSSVISWNSIDRSRTLFTKLYLCLLFERKWSRLFDLIYWRRRVCLTREVVTAGDSSSSCTAETRVSILLSFTLYYGAYL